MKKQAPVLQRRTKDKEINKRALIWVGSIVAAIVVLMTVLLVVNG